MRREPIWPELAISRQMRSLVVVKVGTMSITGELLQEATITHSDIAGPVSLVPELALTCIFSVLPHSLLVVKPLCRQLLSWVLVKVGTMSNIGELLQSATTALTAGDERAMTRLKACGLCRR